MHFKGICQAAAKKGSQLNESIRGQAAEPLVVKPLAHFVRFSPTRNADRTADWPEDF